MTFDPHQTNFNILPRGTILEGLNLLVGPTLGQGPTSITYLVADAQRRSYVVKEFFPHGSSRNGLAVIPPPGLGHTRFEAARDEFLQEAYLRARLPVPLGPPLLHHCQANNTAYLLLQFAEGEPLQTHLSRVRRLSPERLADLAVRLLEKLQVAADAQIPHLDVAPRSIFLTQDNQVWLLGGGVARYQLGRVLGGPAELFAPNYTPPELLTGQDGHPSADVFGLAMTLWRSFSGFDPPGLPEPLAQTGFPPSLRDTLVLLESTRGTPASRPTLAALATLALPESWGAEAEPPRGDTPLASWSTSPTALPTATPNDPFSEFASVIPAMPSAPNASSGGSPAELDPFALFAALEAAPPTGPQAPSGAADPFALFNSAQGADEDAIPDFLNAPLQPSLASPSPSALAAPDLAGLPFDESDAFIIDLGDSPMPTSPGAGSVAVPPPGAAPPFAPVSPLTTAAPPATAGFPPGFPTPASASAPVAGPASPPVAIPFPVPPPAPASAAAGPTPQTVALEQEVARLRQQAAGLQQAIADMAARPPAPPQPVAPVQPAEGLKETLDALLRDVASLRDARARPAQEPSGQWPMPPAVQEGLKQLQDGFKSLTDQQDALRQALEALRAERQIEQAAQGKQRDETQTLLQGFQRLQEAHQSAQKSLLTLQEERQTTLRGLRRLHEENQAFRQAFKVLRDEQQKLRQGLKSVHDTSGALQLLLQAFETHHQSLEGEQGQLRQAHEELRESLRLLRDDLHRLREEGLRSGPRLLPEPVQAAKPGDTSQVRRAGFVSGLTLPQPGEDFARLHLAGAIGFDASQHEVVVWRHDGGIDRLWAVAEEGNAAVWRFPLSGESPPPLAVGVAEEGLYHGSWWSPDWVEGLHHVAERDPEEALLLARWFELPVGDEAAGPVVRRLVEAHPGATLSAWMPGRTDVPVLGGSLVTGGWLRQVAPLLENLEIGPAVVEGLLHGLALDEADRPPEERSDLLKRFEPLGEAVVRKLEASLESLEAGMF
ncbi:MAG: protein kinase [Candidatus Sericytochromatia bacterium]|nr:protein kinase [Candidatus Sericytochromatia bacterium]